MKIIFGPSTEKPRDLCLTESFYGPFKMTMCFDTHVWDDNCTTIIRDIVYPALVAYGFPSGAIIDALEETVDYIKSQTIVGEQK